MNTLLVSHDEDIENKISYFVDRITERVMKKSLVMIIPNEKRIPLTCTFSLASPSAAYPGH